MSTVSEGLVKCNNPRLHANELGGLGKAEFALKHYKEQIEENKIQEMLNSNSEILEETTELHAEEETLS